MVNAPSGPSEPERDIRLAKQEEDKMKTGKTWITDLPSCLAGSVLAATVLAAPALAGEINVGYFGNVAIKGYDPVAYFTQSQAVKGSPTSG